MHLFPVDRLLRFGVVHHVVGPVVRLAVTGYRDIGLDAVLFLMPVMVALREAGGATIPANVSRTAAAKAEWCTSGNPDKYLAPLQADLVREAVGGVAVLEGQAYTAGV